MSLTGSDDSSSDVFDDKYLTATPRKFDGDVSEEEFRVLDEKSRKLNGTVKFFGNFYIRMVVCFLLQVNTV